MIKVRFGEVQSAEAFARDLYRIKYASILLEILADNIDNILVDMEAPIQRLHMSAMAETKMQLGRLVRCCKEMRRTSKVLCQELYDDAKEKGEEDISIMDLSDGINSLLSMFALDADTSEEALEKMLAKVTETFLKVKDGQVFYDNAIATIADKIGKL